jgi:hypothetical protein
MNKTIIFAITTLSLAFGFTACASIDSASKNGDQINFSAQYIRTDEYHTDEQYPVVKVISSKQELDQLYAEKYDMSAYSYIEPNINFDNAMKNYSEGYFQNKFLVIVVLEEGSGSIRHNVEKIESDGKIFISRLVPEIGTADMAKWSIIIELENNVNAREFTVEFASK